MYVPSVCMSLRVYIPCMSPLCVCPLHVYVHFVYVSSMCMSPLCVCPLHVYVPSMYLFPPCVCSLHVYIPFACISPLYSISSVWCPLRVYVSLFGYSIMCMLSPCMTLCICSERFARRPNHLSGRRANRPGRFNGRLDKAIGQRPVWLSALPANRPSDTRTGRQICWQDRQPNRPLSGSHPNSSDTIKIAENG